MGLTEQTPPGFVAQWRRLTQIGIPVLAVRDNPRFDFSMPDCVQQRDVATAFCGAPRGDLCDPPWVRIDDLPDTGTSLDIADAVCDADRCPATIGNVLVYLDDNHLTASCATTIAPSSATA